MIGFFYGNLTHLRVAKAVETDCSPMSVGLSIVARNNFLRSAQGASTTLNTTVSLRVRSASGLDGLAHC